MSVSRLEHITKIGVEQMGDLADSLKDPSILRLENLDTNIPPPAEAVEFTRNAIGDDDANSYLPFLGLDSLRQAATSLVGRQSGCDYDWKTVVVSTVQHENGNGCPRDEGNDIRPTGCDPPGYEDRDLNAALERAKIRRHVGSVTESHIRKVIGVDIGTRLQVIDGSP